jgi:hypothetical protein
VDSPLRPSRRGGAERSGGDDSDDKCLLLRHFSNLRPLDEGLGQGVYGV